MLLSTKASTTCVSLFDCTWADLCGCDDAAIEWTGEVGISGEEGALVDAVVQPANLHTWNVELSRFLGEYCGSKLSNEYVQGRFMYALHAFRNPRVSQPKMKISHQSDRKPCLPV